MADKPWSIYIVECSDGKLYTGISNNVAKRVDAHSRGKGCRFTRYRYPVKLVYQELCGTKSDARKREIRVQKLQRYQKLRLIVFYNKI